MDKLLKFLKNHSIIAYLIIDKDGEITDTSANIEKLLITEKNIVTIARPYLWLEDIAKFELFINNLVKTGYDEGNFEIKISKENYERITLIGFKPDERKSEYFIGVHKTPNHSTANNLNIINYEDFYKSFSKVFTGLYLEFNENFKLINFMGDTIEFFGIKETDFQNNFRDLSDFVYEEDLEKFRFIHSLPNISKNLSDFIFRIKRTDGSFFWALEFLILVESQDKKTINILFYNIDNYKKDYDYLHNSKAQILELANHLELTREQERKNMAREIHDEIGHALTSLKLNINLLLKKRYLREEKLESRLAEMMKHIEDTIRMLQRISAQLRPSILDHFGLIAALEWQAKEFQRSTSIRCKYSIPEEDIEINEQKTVAVFRIFQEILTNIARHSQASRVDVFLTVDNNILDLKVSDNGIGIRKEDLESPKSLGLIGLKERANLVEGKLTINTILNIGTTVQLILPLN